MEAPDEVPVLGSSQENEAWLDSEPGPMDILEDYKWKDSYELDPFKSPLIDVRM